MKKIFTVLGIRLAVGLALVLALPAKAASLQQITAWGTNVPVTGDGPITMWAYVPDTRPANPPILVAVHYCGGNAAGMFGESSGGGLVSAANQYGFIMIFPQATDNTATNGRCWDVGSTNSLTRYGGGDTAAIVGMVKYAITNYHADSNRVYVVGTSSGAMMTEGLLALYPDIFKAGAEFSGVPAGGWAVSDPSGTWSGPCAGGQVTNTPPGWGNIARAMYPGYAGPRPRIQLWHGSADTTISYTNQLEAIKEWTDVLGLNAQPTLSTNGLKLPNDTNQWTRQVWLDPCGNALLDVWSEINGPHGTGENLNGQNVIPFLRLNTAGASDPIGSCAALLAAPTGLAAAAFSGGQINLGWNAHTNAISYNVKRSLTNGGPFTVAAAGIMATNYTDAGLVNGTTYYYAVSAVGADGEGNNSAQASATTLLTPQSPTLTATTVATNQVNLTWNASTTATGYNVKRSTTNGGPYTVIATVTTTGYTDTAVTSGTTYYYVVSAVNAYGESADSAQASAAPANFPAFVEEFAYPAGNLAGNNGGSGFSAAWNAGGSVVSPGLTNGALAVAGNAASLINQTAFRPLGRSFNATNSGQIWVGVLMERMDANGQWGGLSLFSGTSTEKFFMGSVGGNYGMVSYASPGASQFNGPASSQGATTFLVYQLQASGTNVAVSFYANPALGDTPPATPTDTATSGDFTFDTIRLGTGGSTIRFDEVRIGASWASVAPTRTAPALAGIASQTIGVGVTLSVTNVTADSDVPLPALRFSLAAAPANAAIDAGSGVLTWRPLVTQANTTNPFTVTVAAPGTPVLSATQSFLVTVTNVVSPQVAAASWNNGQLVLGVNGAGGPDYEVQASTNLVDWSPVFTTNSPALPFVWTASTTNGPVNFFRIVLGPPWP